MTTALLTTYTSTVENPKSTTINIENEQAGTINLEVRCTTSTRRTKYFYSKY